MSETFAQLFEKSLNQFDVKQGTTVDATVIEISDNHVTVDAGLKAESFIPKQQFVGANNEMETLKVGDKVTVLVESLEGYDGPVLSRDKARKMEVWTRLERALEANETIIGKVIERVKGGFTVDVGINAFLPGSLVDVRPVRDTSYLEGKECEFKVIKVDQRRNNIVVSRRAVIEAESSVEREALLENLQEGQVIHGMVKSITDYGAFIDLGGIDGLLHITDMSWKRVKHPTELFNTGDEIDVMVIRFDKEKNRVSLGLKQLGNDPWRTIEENYPAGTRLSGKVTNITDYGCFVEMEEGVEGLVHVSEMDWTNKNVNPNKVVQPGQEVNVIVLEVDKGRRRISLGMKQCTSNPWDAFAATQKKGDKIKGAIRSITDFGLFIGLEGGIDGLVHMTDISWAGSPEAALREYKKGQEVEAVILSIDAERERIALGIKQLDGDSFSEFLSDHDKGASVKGLVKSVEDDRIVVVLAPDVLGYLAKADVSDELVSDGELTIQEGQELEARIVKVDKKERQITLSMKAAAKEKSKKPAKRSTEAPASVMLGDLLKEKMEAAKQKEE